MDYLKLGINVIAVNEHKRAIFPWKEYQARMITREEFDKQMSDPKARGVAVICGAVSGGLEVIDIDTKYATYDLWEAIKAKIPSELMEMLYVVRTRSGGVHIYYKCEVIEGNQKLANRELSTLEKKASPHLKTLTIIETRGEGGYVVAPPTQGYQVEQGDEPKRIEIEDRERLLSIMRSFNEVLEEVVIEAGQRPSPKEYGKSPFDDYNSRGDIVELMTRNDWSLVKNGGDRIFFLRPGGTSEHSGSWNKTLGLFSVFSTNTPFIVQKGYKLAAVFAVLECGGDFSMAAKKLVEMGYGERRSNIDYEVYQKREEGYSNDEIVDHLVRNKNVSIKEAQGVVGRLEEREPVLTFWDVEVKGKKCIAIINRYKLQSYLTKVGGFMLYFYEPNGTDYRLIRMVDGFVRESSTEEIKKFIKGYLDKEVDDLGLEQSPQSIMELVYKGSSQLFNDGFFEFFDRAELDFLRDDRETAYFPFKNGVVVVNKDGVGLRSYGELGKVIWESQVIDHYIVVDQEQEADQIEYFRFLKRICGDDMERVLYCMGLIGYLLHKYKDPAKPFSVILAEETENEAKGGGTGKGIFVKALGYLVNLVRVDGKNFKIDKNFAFQRVDLDTRILAIEDTRKNVDFEGFYSIITEGITIEKKNKDEFFIPYKDSPKVMFTTNYTIPNMGTHAKRRQRVLEFSPYFGADRTPEDEFGKKLFEDWDSDEWNRFFNLMFQCVNDYLLNGITQVKNSNKLSRKQVRVQFGEEFLDYFDAIKTGDGWTSLEQLYNDFLKMAGFEKKDYSVKRFSRAIEESATILGFELQITKDRSANNKKAYKFIYNEEMF
jgi:hypothetical protein